MWEPKYIQKLYPVLWENTKTPTKKPKNNGDLEGDYLAFPIFWFWTALPKYGFGQQAL